LVPREISLIITSIIFSENDDFAVDGVLGIVITVKRAKGRVIKGFKSVKLTDDEDEKVTIIYRII